MIYRPLIDYKKENILLLCKSIQLPYVVDIHNTDLTQKRILLRNRMSNQSQEKQNVLYTDRSYIYTYFEKEIEIKEQNFFPVLINTFRPIKQMYYTITPTTIHQLQQQLSWCGLYTNISEKRLKSLLEAFSTAQSFYLQGRWFLQRK